MTNPASTSLGSPVHLDARAEARHRSRRAKEARRAFAYVLPTWIFILAVGVIPVGYGLWMSVSDQSLASENSRFVGPANFTDAVFTAAFSDSLHTTLLFVILGLALQLIVGYLLASALNRQLRGFKFVRTILLIPMLLTPVVVGLTWRFMLDPELGVLTYLFGLLGLHANWLADPVFSPALVVLVDSWMHIPFVMLMVVAGMAGISQETLEAASMDGAGWWARTRYVVLPLLAPVLMITLLVRCIDIARLFDIIYVTTQGGPGVSTQNASLLVFANTFQFYQFGYGAAMAIALTVLMFPVYFLYLRLTHV